MPYSGIKPQRVNVTTLPEFQKGILPSDYGLDFENTELENQLIERIHNLPIVKARETAIKRLTKGKRHLTYWVNELNPPDSNVYEIVVAEDNGMSFATHFRFHIDKKSFKILNKDGKLE